MALFKSNKMRWTFFEWNKTGWVVESKKEGGVIYQEVTSPGNEKIDLNRLPSLGNGLERERIDQYKELMDNLELKYISRRI